jgi:hypothetical protein
MLYSLSNIYRYSTSVLILLGACGYFGLISWYVGGICVSGVVIALFVLRMDKGLSMLHIAAVLACLQWVLGPVWYFVGDYNIPLFGMAVPPDIYFGLAIPGTVSFSLGLLILGKFPNQKLIISKLNKDNYFVVGLLLNLVAFISDIGGALVPVSLRFVFYLLSQLRYVGVLYLFFSTRKGAKVYAFLFLLPLFVSTAESAMFHDMLLWVGILFSFWFATKKRSMLEKVLIILISILCCFSVQGLKQNYRAKIWTGYEASALTEIIDFWEGFMNFDRDQVYENVLIRLNQGWIISNVQAHVPKIEPYARGETVINSLIATLVPRFVYAGKSRAGGRENFTRFTGIPIKGVTSMNLSLLGEGYANYGRNGAFVFLFLVGISISAVHRALMTFIFYHPSFIFWLPLVFLHAIKAETDLTEVINHIVKSSIFSLACFRLLNIFCAHFSVRNVKSG